MLAADPPAPADEQPSVPRPHALLRSRSHLAALLLGAALGVPVAAIAYLFLAAIDQAQQYVFTTLPRAIGFDAAPWWWPIPLLGLSGLLIGLVIRHLPGTGGHEPAVGFAASGPVAPSDLPGIVLAALAAAGVGTLIFLGLDTLTGLGMFSLGIPDIPGFGTPTVAEFGCSICSTDGRPEPASPGHRSSATRSRPTSRPTGRRRSTARSATATHARHRRASMTPMPGVASA